MKTYKVLTVRQPWAQLIVHGTKPVENRTWQTNYRGVLVIHAAARPVSGDARNLCALYGLDPDDLHYGAAIGVVELTDIVTDHRSRFFTGPFGWVLRHPRVVHPVPLRGQLKLFEADLQLRRT